MFSGTGFPKPHLKLRNQRFSVGTVVTEFTTTFSNRVEFNTALLWDATARPTSRFLFNRLVTPPAASQLVPSTESQPVK